MKGREDTAVLLDTCAILYIALATGIQPEADEVVLLGTLHGSTQAKLFVGPRRRFGINVPETQKWKPSN